MRTYSLNDVRELPPTLVLTSLWNPIQSKRFELFDRIKIGRQVSPKTSPDPKNGYFDSKVLSRTHAEVWSENGQVYVKDLKSSNGTYLNERRLSPEGVESQPHELRNGDLLEFGIDILETEQSGRIWLVSDPWVNPN
ncbi:SMAD/FHA domain-containing protein [Basidiobolus meristosporus CBS 931.73]|uniref:SMAD/FHA domain-containing protein n=1 Tax=Basidiobolus meristosporus CBS 931.73 TaxID=1314790 RepID=A0A1Y1XUG2_9FUNG|nr:SMAD/FHA domain-containing protein [Basidiobolus meristosporus CBS 931.73]|eukprot:ORX89388.1 SMAD/FHA domain-containing protein [Basidiobolus meristosporus CBS 931.73]